MNIVFFHRNPIAGHSIRRAFEPLVHELSKENHIKEFYMKYHGGFPIILIKNMIYAYKNRCKNGINHVSGGVYYLGAVLPNCVLTYHDMFFIKDNKGLKKLYLLLFWVLLPAKHAKQIVCISEQTKTDLIKLMPSVKNKISVIENCLLPGFKYMPKQFNETKPCILCIGTDFNKNLINTINALNETKCELRIIGKINKEQEDSLNTNKIEYFVTDSISDAEIIEEYNKCDIVSFISYQEGFGMPIIEGQAIGRIVITSDLSPMKEIANGGAVLSNPYSIKDIRNKFKDIIKNGDMREATIKRGLENIKRFNPVIIAKKQMIIYNRINKR